MARSIYLDDELQDYLMDLLKGQKDPRAEILVKKITQPKRGAQ